MRTNLRFFPLNHQNVENFVSNAQFTGRRTTEKEICFLKTLDASQ